MIWSRFADVLMTTSPPSKSQPAGGGSVFCLRSSSIRPRSRLISAFWLLRVYDSKGLSENRQDDFMSALIFLITSSEASVQPSRVPCLR